MSKLDMAIAALADAPKVNIHGKNYTQVSTRVEIFRRFFGVKWAITTEVQEATDTRVRVKAAIFNPDDRLIAVDHAEEVRKGGVNITSALENCCTSAIGRALAAFGLHGGEYASSDEVTGAINQEKVTVNAKVRATRGAKPKEKADTTPPIPAALVRAHMIDVPQITTKDGALPDWKSWCNILLEKMVACLSKEQIEEWKTANAAPLKNLQAELPDWVEKLEQKITEIQNDL
jgi:hypothetical protein